MDLCGRCSSLLPTAGRPPHVVSAQCQLCHGTMADDYEAAFGDALAATCSRYDASGSAHVTIVPCASHIFRWCCLSMSLGSTVSAAEATVRDAVKDRFLSLADKRMAGVSVRSGRCDYDAANNHLGLVQLTVTFDWGLDVAANDANVIKQCFARDIEPKCVSASSVMDILQEATAERIAAASERFLGEAKPAVAPQCCIDAKRTPIHVAGRYLKFSRSLNHTPWSADDDNGESAACTSLGGALCQLAKSTFDAADVNFVSAGREDRDVRMLGAGRAFVLRVMDAKRLAALTGDTAADGERLGALQARMNGLSDDFEVRDLQLVGASALQVLKQGEQAKTKVYVALCHSPDATVRPADLDKLKNACPVVLSQETPVRVLQRRSVTSRQRSIYSMTPVLIDAHNFMLELTTQAGTYVKEFVHGDFGRTKPSVAHLLWPDAPHDNTVDILQLDVIAVNLDWPLKL